MTSLTERTNFLRRVGFAGGGAALVGGIACAIGYGGFREQFYPAYLTAYFYWLDISLGCLGLAMLHGLTGGGWGIAVRRAAEAGYATLPLMALLFVPLWLGVAQIYPWADPEVVRHHEVLLRKARYLNVDGFHLRAGAIFLVWLVVAKLLDLASPRGDTEPGSARAQRLQLVSGLGFIAYAFSLTPAAVDWVMSLEPQWYSTMYGVLYMAAQAVAGLSFVMLVVTGLGRFQPWSHGVTVSRRHDLGNLLLAFVMFWAYVNFMQFLIIWSGNLPEESVWYLRRSQGGWQYVVIGLALLHFATPFLLLLSRDRKRQGAGLGSIAALLMVMQYVSLLWMIVPAFDRHETHDGAPTPSVWIGVGLSAAAWAAVGGAWTALFAWRLAVRIREPMYDPEPTEASHDGTGRIVAA